MELSDYVEKLIGEIKKIGSEVLIQGVSIELDADGKPVSAKIELG